MRIKDACSELKELMEWKAAEERLELINVNTESYFDLIGLFFFFQNLDRRDEN